MAVKANWQNGEQFNASDQNAVAEAVNAAYVKPTGGVPITDLTASVQVSLGKADTAVQSVNAASITDSTTTGRAVITAADAAAARTALGVAYGSTAGTVVEGNDSRLSPSSASITDSTATGRSLITAVDPAAARSAIGVAYGSTGGTVAQGNDSRIVGAEQTANKGVANGYASLDGGGKVPVTQLPSSIMQYQGTYNASTNSPSLSNGTGDTGDVYRVTVAGTRNFGAGNISFEVGDYVIYNSSGVWEKSDTTDAVSTVAGLTGDVTASSLRGAIATGTPSSTTWLRGDGAWATLPPSGITRSIQTITSNATLGASGNTDYVVYSNIPFIPEVQGDTHFSSVVALLKLDGDNDSTLMTDNSSLSANWTVTGTGAKLSTAQKKFGSTSLGVSSGFISSSAASSNFAFGTGSWTIEFWVFHGGPSKTLFEASGGTALSIWAQQPNFTQTYYGFTTPAGSITSNDFGLGNYNTWNHIALCRSGTSTRLFVNGVQRGATQGDSTNYASTGFQTGSNYSGYIDEIRITKGVARYTANFTPPSVEFYSAAPVPAVSPQLDLPTVNTNEYKLWNLNSTSLSVRPQTGQTIDGATGYTMAQGDKKTFLSDGASGWRAW